MKYPFHVSERWIAALFLTGQVLVRLFKGRLYRREILEHMVTVGPGAFLPVILVTGASGMIFTLQMGRYLSDYNALSALGGAFGEAFCRELAPILTASVVAGQVGSAFAAEIGAMRVSEQIDALQMLRTDPINYLVVPRAIACCLMVPVLTIFALTVGLAAGTAIASQLYQVDAGAFLDSVQAFLSPLDVLVTLFKAFVFGAIDALVGCSWGLTTQGGAREVGQSATTAVVTAWILIFASDLLLSLLFYGQPVL
jgi:phospholipid/cholesterol/gamma-HCH transport system permease protein